MYIFIGQDDGVMFTSTSSGCNIRSLCSKNVVTELGWHWEKWQSQQVKQLLQSPADTIIRLRKGVTADEQKLE